MKYIFDVDGTLTPSRQEIDPEFKDFFLDFCNNNEVYLVTGSDRSKTAEQIGEEIYIACKKVYQCSGNQVFEGEKLLRVSSWSLEKDEIEFLEDKLDSSQFPLRTGTHIEDRPGMVNFSVVGRGATLGERLFYVEYDKKTDERVRIAREFKEKFPHLEAVVGGETGIDIFPVGKDKSQIIDDFLITSDRHFFGDRMDPAGNDYSLALAVIEGGGKSHPVKNWKHTQYILAATYSALSSVGLEQQPSKL